MRHVQEHMGMPISIDIPITKSEAIFADLFAICEDTDTRFSPYKPNSELNALWKGSIKERDTSIDMQHIITVCKKYEAQTDKYFSAHFAGRFNPTGYVKAWCMQRMATYLAKNKIETYMLNAGGDIVAKSNGAHRWRIAIANPHNTAEAIATLDIDTIAVATSGSYEKGSHIFDPHTRQPVNELASVTIFGPDIETVDVYATAIYAMGEQKGMEFIRTQENYNAIVVRQDGSIITSS